MDCCDTPGLHGLKIEVDVAEELNDGHPSKLKNKGESCLILIQKQLYFNDFCFVVVVFCCCFCSLQKTVYNCRLCFS